MATRNRIGMLRRARSLLTALVIGGSLQAAAATDLPVTSAPVGAGTVAVATCDGNGFVLRLAVSGAGAVTAVNASGIHAACAGGTLRVTLVNGTASVGSGSAALPSSGFTGTVDIVIGPQPSSAGVTAVHAAIEGP